MSVLLSTALPRACSGDMYAAVPRITPACVRPPVAVGNAVGLSCAMGYPVAAARSLPAASSGRLSALARPKSSTLTLPSGVSFTFAGFRSRCTIPFSCAASSASAIWRAIARASSTGIGPAAIRSPSVPPSTSSSTSASRLPDFSSP